ncbi:YitT family protein [Pseudoneobacillus sp. C159]
MYLVKKVIAIIVGSFLVSIGINLFLVPYELLDGGIIGLGLILKYLLGIKVGLAIILMSIPIFVIAWFYNRDYFLNSLNGMLFLSFNIDFLVPGHSRMLSFIRFEPFLSSIIGGILVGLGIGIMLRQGTSTGGTDLLAQFLSNIVHINECGNPYLPIRCYSHLPWWPAHIKRNLLPFPNHHPIRRRLHHHLHLEHTK